MENTTLPNKLTEFGLNSYETKLWLTLLSEGPLVVGELSDIANVPRSRSYDVLESLEKKGFIHIKKRKPVRCETIPPDLVIENMKKRIKKTLEEEKTPLNKLKTKKLFLELEKIYKRNVNTNKQNNPPGLLKNKTNTKNQLQYMIKKAEKFVYIIDSGENTPSIMQFLSKHLPRLEEKGVIVNIMVNGPFNKKKKTNSQNLKLKETNLPNRLCIIDGNEMLFGLSGDKEVAVLVKTPTFIKSVVKLFENQWDNSNFVV